MPEATSVDFPKEAVEELRGRIEELEQRVNRCGDANKLTLVVFSGELDKLLAAFVLATGAAACDMQVTLFFTFWGTASLKKHGRQASNKSLVERMFGWMLPGGFGKRRLSRMDLAGVGRWMMRREMRKKRVPDLESLIKTAAELGVSLYLCETSMSLMGLRREELIEYPNMQICGVAHFLDEASKAGTTLFI